MTASYPNSSRAFRNPTSSTTAVQSDGTDLHAADHTAVEEEVAAISSDLISARGAAANMAAKITAMDASISGAALKASNLSDLASASTARTNLGLGGAATLSVGTTAGTVAAGDDSRFANQNTRPYVLVASSEASATLKSSADYVCTGTNDEVVIQNAIKYAGDNAINHVKLSSGTFYIDALDVINLAGPDTAGTTFYRSMRLEGAGLPYASGASRYGTVLRWDVASVPASKQAILSIRPYTSDPGTGRTRHRYHINNIAIDGNGYNNVIGLKMQWVNIFYLADVNIVGCRGFGLYMNGVSDGTVERLRFNSCGTANTTSGASSTAGTMISDNIGGWTSDNIVFRDCTWENGMERFLMVVSQDPDSILRGGSYTSQQALYNIQFDRCKFEAIYTSGGSSATNNALIQVEGVQGFYMRNCYFYGGSPTSSWATPAISASNKPNAYISLRSVYNVNISNSFFSNTSTLSSSVEPSSIYGIYIDNGSAAAGLGAVAQGITIMNNEFSGANTWNSKSIVWVTNNNTIYNVSNTGNWGRDLLVYTFTITSAAVVAGDIYTAPLSSGTGNYVVTSNGTVTTLLTVSNSGTPSPTNGTLTRASGTGPATLSFSNVTAGTTPTSVESKTGSGALGARPTAQT